MKDKSLIFDMPNQHRFAKIAISAMLIAGAFAPMSVGATTVNDAAGSYLNFSVDQLQSLIAKLQARLEELKKGTPCFVTDAALSLGDGEGSEANDVRRLQDFLREKGYFNYKSTGYFGKVTRSSLVAFQKGSGLDQTGEFDAATKAKAHSLSCTVLKAIKNAEPKKEDKKKEVTENSGRVSSISMQVNGSSVSWTTNGYSQNGFKVVWSKNAAPTYPTRDGDQYIYLSEPSASSATLEAFDGSGSYHVRVCEYLGGACGVYSNEATTNL